MLDGGCACGAVTYSMNTQPIVVHCCHCSECQRQTGSAFVLNAIIEADRVVFDGPITEVTLPTPSGNGQVVTRCRECGVAVFSNYLSRQGKLRYIRVGTMDQPGKCPPHVHIFTSSKLPWLTLSSDVPIFEGFYRFEEVLPEASMARWNTLFGD
jgi:hypothetical protein